MNSITILGCGWLGLEVAKFFIEKGIIVNGSTTSKDKIEILEKEGIKPYLIDLRKENIQNSDDKNYFKDFFETDILLINIPPPKEKKEFYKTQMEYIKNHLLQNNKATKKVIFVSSTSIYKDFQIQLNTEFLPTTKFEVIENDVQNSEQANRKDIFEAENVFVQTSKTTPLETVILRAGGLMGGQRIAGKYLAGKKDLNIGLIPTNFIHRKDLTTIVWQIAKKMKENTLFNSEIQNKSEVFNVVTPEHPTRQKVYQQNAKDYNFESPTFKNDNQLLDCKIVSSTKLQNQLGYEFIYPNPLYFPIES